MEQTKSSRLPLLFLSALLIGLVTYVQWPETESEKKRYQRIVTVKTAQVIDAEFSDEFEALGTSLANESVIITSQRSDIVEQVLFNDGDIVKKGQILVELRKEAEQANVRELQANLKESSAQLTRYNELRKQDVASIAQLEEQQAKTESIQARLKNVQAELAKLTIKAPFDGQLGFRNVSVGSSVKNGDVITSLDDLSTIKVDFFIPEQYLPTIKVKQVINSRNVAYPGVTFKGIISSISPRIDAKTRMVKVRALLPNDEGKLRPGMLMAITIKRKVEHVLQLPETAVIPFEDSHFVFLNNDGVVARTPIVIGRRKPGVVEIISGLNAGDEVVTEGALKLRDGSSIKVKSEEGK
ncbi:efflux RND transporter periplasmic adaptor subunit [Thalassomonas sp. M1454]|uniref:efflux RND transporter periplasmic adaptor subunit n=1 Tax=Thalassomonas sp. M1454 TaxID=2594477 RepID=UPI00163D9FAD|nr:efflux RND transporter periplasmic adaptor subunit [Thalassomonas sp. M1454]